MCAVVTMATFQPAPQKIHLYRLKRIYSYLQNHKKTATKFNTEVSDYAGFKVLGGNWGIIYRPCREYIPRDALEKKGKAV